MGVGVDVVAGDSAADCAGAAQPLSRIMQATSVAPPIFDFMVKSIGPRATPGRVGYFPNLPVSVWVALLDGSCQAPRLRQAQPLGRSDSQRRYPFRVNESGKSQKDGITEMKWYLSATVVIVVAAAWWCSRMLLAEEATQAALSLLALASGMIAGIAALTTWLICNEAGR